MKTFAIAFIGAVSGHTLQNEEWFAANSKPADFHHIAAIGETYHSAWTRCYKKTTEWLRDELKMDEMDKTFDNSYYSEYGIKTKVPEVYDIFRELLGEEHYWPAPVFSGSTSEFRVTFADWDPASHAQISQAVSGEGELPEPYQPLKDLDWIIQHNHPNPEDLTIEVYGGVKETELRRRHEGYKKLYKLFYNIQQTSYYCDFTLESAQYVFEKYGRADDAKMIEEERNYQKKIWSYILKEQIAPVRWSMFMWTRYNIAEPSIHNSIQVFNDDWNSVLEALKDIGARDLAPSLGWEGEGKTYDERLAHWTEVKQGWIASFNKWINSCYVNKPDDDKVESQEGICEDGLEFSEIMGGVRDATSMWFDFAVPLLDAYKESQGHKESVYNQAYHAMESAIYETGKVHSFRCEWLWICTRVRYFEIIPTWEIQRVARDTQTNWDIIMDFRSQMIAFDDVDATDIYSEKTKEEMEAHKDEIIDFLTRWAGGDKSVFDSDGELHRRYLRKTTKDLSEKALEVYNWYFNMAYEQMEWKDGKKYASTESTNYYWGSKTPPSKSRTARDHANSISRDTWRLGVWREMTKFHFHTWRRI